MGQVIQFPTPRQTDKTVPPSDELGAGRGEVAPTPREPCRVTFLWDWVSRAREARRAGRGRAKRRADFDRLIKRSLDRQRGEEPYV